MGVHRAANIKKGEHFNRVAPLRPHLYIQPALLGCAAYRSIKIKFIQRAFAGKFTQTAKRDFDISSPNLAVAIKIFKGPLIPDLGCFFVVAFSLTNADTFGVIAISAKGGCACCTDIFTPAFMAFILIFDCLLYTSPSPRDRG